MDFEAIGETWFCEYSDRGDWNKLDGLIPAGNVITGIWFTMRLAGRLRPKLKATSFPPLLDSPFIESSSSFPPLLGADADADAAVEGPMAPARSWEKEAP